MKDYELLTCGKCGNQWKVGKTEWLLLSKTTGKIPHCPKCGAGRIFWQEQKNRRQDSKKNEKKE
jgi:DNA-directed RNA polymerase subunit M/transcription elongation factor TFIIS